VINLVCQIQPGFRSWRRSRQGASLP